MRVSQDVHQPAEDPSPATPDDMPGGNAESVLDAHRSTAAEEGASHPVEQLVSDARPHNETPVQPMTSPGESLNNLPRVRERERERERERILFATALQAYQKGYKPI